MNRTDIRIQDLNAYVDGELSRTESAAVARAAADDPAIAARIATLREMKAAVSEVAPARHITLRAGRRVWPRRAGMAAAAVLVMLAAATLLQLQPWRAEPGVAQARALQAQHENWTVSGHGERGRVVSARAIASLMPLDLKAARLTYVGREAFSLGGRPAQRYGYEGSRGCRVSLFVLPPGTRLDGTGFTSSLLVRDWTIRDHGFALMADGMDAKRFSGLAKAVEQALRSGLDFDPRTRQRLAQARRTSLPCQA